VVLGTTTTCLAVTIGFRYDRPTLVKTSGVLCSVGEPAEGSLQRTYPLGYISHPLSIIPLLLWQACSITTGLGWLVPARGPLNSFILLSEYYIIFKTFNNGSLGSGIDEERSEMR
jgi:hypothetical protein